MSKNNITKEIEQNLLNLITDNNSKFKIKHLKLSRMNGRAA